MKSQHSLSRRSLLALAGALPLASRLAARSKKLPVGLEMYSVRRALAEDVIGTTKQVAAMGYQVVEYFSPYYDWTPQMAKDVRKVLDDAGVKCLSTHNGPKSFSPDGMQKAIDLNGILGARYIVMASPGRREETADDWKQIAAMVTQGHEAFQKAGLSAGYHNHNAEWAPVEGKSPMQIIAENTPKGVALQLDTGSCLHGGGDPVAWIEAHPGRIKSLHVKDWSPTKGYDVLMGDGNVPLKKVFAAAERVGGVEYYLVEQEGGVGGEFETAKKSLDLFHQIHG